MIKNLNIGMQGYIILCQNIIKLGHQDNISFGVKMIYNFRFDTIMNRIIENVEKPEERIFAIPRNLEIVANLRHPFVKSK